MSLEDSGAEAEPTGCRRPGAEGEERLSEGELLVFPGGGMSGVHADSELGGSGGWKRCAPLSLSWAFSSRVFACSLRRHRGG